MLKEKDKDRKRHRYVDKNSAKQVKENKYIEIEESIKTVKNMKERC